MQNAANAARLGGTPKHIPTSVERDLMGMARKEVHSSLLESPSRDLKEAREKGSYDPTRRTVQVNGRTYGVHGDDSDLTHPMSLFPVKGSDIVSLAGDRSAYLHAEYIREKSKGNLPPEVDLSDYIKSQCPPLRRS